MNRQKIMTIKYSWWSVEDPLSLIKSTHIEALEERAEEIIKEEMAKGCNQGLLTDNIFMTAEDINSKGQEGIDYQGWWSVSTEVAE